MVRTTPVQHHDRRSSSVSSHCGVVGHSTDTRSGGQASQIASDRRDFLDGDAIPPSPVEYARLLRQIAEEQAAARAVLPKAIFTAVPWSRSSSCANSLARNARSFSRRARWQIISRRVNSPGDRRRVIVQQESHLYRDEGDCAQFLSGLNLIPVAPGRAVARRSTPALLARPQRDVDASTAIDREFYDYCRTPRGQHPRATTAFSRTRDAQMTLFWSYERLN